jgi:2-phospho-L-lactate guanylyltransferase (CobY/MobA/RfbA family)
LLLRRRHIGSPALLYHFLIASFARWQGFRVIADETEAGFRAAATAGARILGRSGARGILVLPADIPLATAEDIDARLREHDRGHHDRGCAVTIVHRRDWWWIQRVGLHTNRPYPVLLRLPQFQLHCRASYASGVVPRVVAAPRLARDTDRPSDLVKTLVPIATREVRAPSAPIRANAKGAWPPVWRQGWKMITDENTVELSIFSRDSKIEKLNRTELLSRRFVT